MKAEKAVINPVARKPNWDENIHQRIGNALSETAESILYGRPQGSGSIPGANITLSSSIPQTMSYNAASVGTAAY
jgi:hypothetical protein